MGNYPDLELFEHHLRQTFRKLITVFHDLDTDCYIVFIGDRLCYKVTNENEQFSESLKNLSKTTKKD